jgi:hypothetical protein
VGISLFGLVLNIVAEVLVLFTAAAVLRARRRSFLNYAFFFFLAIFFFWLPAMAVKSVLAENAPDLLYLPYRWSLSVAAVGLGCFALFAHSLRRRRLPPVPVTGAVSALSLVVFSVGVFTPWVIPAARLEGSAVYVDTGPFYPFTILVLAAYWCLGFANLLAAVRGSRGYDRVRKLNILIGLVLFSVPIGASGIIFHLNGNRDPTGDILYALSMVPPLSIFAYAVLRYHQLDARVAARRAFAYLLAVLALGIPAGTVILLARRMNASNTAQYIIYALMMCLVVLLAPPVKDAADRVASNLIFFRLYDLDGLLARISSALASSAGLEDGLERGMATAAQALGVDGLLLSFHPALSCRWAGRALGVRRDGSGAWAAVDETVPSFQHLNEWTGPLFTGEPDMDGWMPWESPARDEALRELDDAGIQAALPVAGPGGLLGTLLAEKRAAVGGQRRRPGLTPLDYDLLEGLARILAPFLENRLLSSYLRERVEELSAVNSLLRREDDYRYGLTASAHQALAAPLNALLANACRLMQIEEMEAEGRRELLEGMLRSAGDLDRRLSEAIGHPSMPSWEAGPAIQEKAAATARGRTDVRGAAEEAAGLFSPPCAARIDLGLERGVCVALSRQRLREGLGMLLESTLRGCGEDGRVEVRAAAAGGRVRLEIRCRPSGDGPVECMRVFSPLSLIAQEMWGSNGDSAAAAARMASSLLGTEVRVAGDGKGRREYVIELATGGPEPAAGRQGEG